MVSFNEVQAQLEGIDAHFRFLGVLEVKKIASMLHPGEQIMVCLKGWYNGAVAVFCATDQRIVIVGKHDKVSQMKCIGYADVSSIGHQDNGLMPRLTFYCSDTQYRFSSWSVKRLKNMHQFMKRHLAYVQEQAGPNQEALFESRFETFVKPSATRRNMHAYVRRLGNASIIS